VGRDDGAVIFPRFHGHGADNFREDFPAMKWLLLFLNLTGPTPGVDAVYNPHIYDTQAACEADAREMHDDLKRKAKDVYVSGQIYCYAIDPQKSSATPVGQAEIDEAARQGNALAEELQRRLDEIVAPPKFSGNSRPSA
jgi:hypothetical protein